MAPDETGPDARPSAGLLSPPAPPMADEAPWAGPDLFDPALLAGEEGEEVPEAVRRWAISAEGEAEWAMAHLRRATEAAAAIDGQAREWADRIEAWRDHRGREHRRTLAFFAGHLERYALARRQADPRCKSLVLPSGVVRTIAVAPAAVVLDHDAVLAWARKHAPDAVKTVETVLVGELRRATRLDEAVTEARVTYSPCGCIDVVRDEGGIEEPTAGDGLDCPQCGADALAARIEVLRSHLVAVAAGADGEPVPGAGVSEPFVRASVVTA